MNGSAPSSDGLEQSLEGTIENLRQMVVMVEDYQATSQPVLFSKMCVRIFLFCVLTRQIQKWICTATRAAGEAKTRI